ncbi:universal stress protein [Pelagibius litoralis]|uniref:Universal stress protein n=1 Tax=Pelagibius litoralis TaxID=374515 RepID=A0A967KFN3_9PROT|nr:universal stress protein [Pelagibius litoralis]NIA71445.1 universal stress protein [Pelagibius litoralis]
MLVFKHIMVPVDGSEHANRAVEIASDLAKKDNTQFMLLHVLTRTGSYDVPKELRSYAEIEHIRITEKDLVELAGKEILSNAANRAREHGAIDTSSRLESGDPASRIAAIARENGVDLIVMGRRGLGDLGGLLFGSVSHKVAQAVECCCLTVK